MDIEKILRNFGVTPKETKVYLAALELGEASPKELASHAGIKRTTLYEMLPKLFRKNLLNQVVHGKRRHLVAESPNRLLSQYKADINTLEKAQPEFLALFNQIKEKPKVYFFDGIEGMKKVYEDILETKRNIRAFSGINDIIQPELIKWLHEYYEPIRIKNQIFARNIANISPNITKLMPPGELRENKFIPAKIYPITTEIIIYGDKVGYTTIRKDSLPLAILIENKEIAESMISIFEAVWKMAKKYK